MSLYLQTGVLKMNLPPCNVSFASSPYQVHPFSTFSPDMMLFRAGGCATTTDAEFFNPYLIPVFSDAPMKHTLQKTLQLFIQLQGNNFLFNHFKIPGSEIHQVINRRFPFDFIAFPIEKRKKIKIGSRRVLVFCNFKHLGDCFSSGNGVISV